MPDRPGPDILPDVLAPGLRVVFCGVAAGRVSAAKGAYYAGPGNRFWPALHAVGLTPRRFAPHEFREVLALGIGLTDLCKTAAGADRELSPDAFDVDGFRAKIRRFRPRTVAFDGKLAALRALARRSVAYGRQDEDLFGAAVFVLPSPSGRARRFWDLGPWAALAAHLAES